MVATMHVLVVDDLEENRYFLVALLRANGCTVETARDGEDALAKARKVTPDVVISDLLMPVMDGFTLLRHWKHDAALKHVPFVVYTASYVEPEDERLARSLGADSFLIKPAEPALLLAELCRLRDTAGAISPDEGSGPLEDETVLLRVYSEALIRKLEKKSLQLETSNRALQHDIAERIRVEESLRLLDSAVTQSREAIVITDAQLQLPGPRIVFVNMAFTRMTGYPASEAIGMTPRMLQGPRTDPAVLSRLRHDLERGDVFEGEAFNYRKDGSDYIQAWQVAPIRDRAGAITHYVAIMRDVSERRLTENALRESQSRLDGIVSSAMDAIISVDDEKNILLANPAAEAMFGYTASELVGLPLDLLMPARFRTGHAQHVATFGESDVNSRRKATLRPVIGVRRNGEEFPVEASISMDDSSGRKLFTAILRDITERTQSEQRIRRLSRVRAVMSGINSLVVRVRDRDELFREACQIAVDKGGFAAAWIGVIVGNRVGVPLHAWAGEATAYRASLEAMLGQATLAQVPMATTVCDGGPVVVNDIAVDARIRLRDEALASGFRSMVALPLRVAGGIEAIFTLYSGQRGLFDDDELKLLLELGDDISLALDHIQKTERLHYLAYHDSLTGLANRGMFLDRVAQHMPGAAVAGCGLALVLIDIERFKNVNGTLGRPAGDDLLRHVAHCMLRWVGDNDLLARTDADHFALLLPDIREADAVLRFLEVSNKALLDAPFTFHGSEVRIATKIGVAMFPADGTDAETLFKHAEAALRKAKTSGERLVFYTQKMTDMVAGKLALENQLRRALDNGEFALHYQPKVNLQSGMLTGAEALIRWNDPRSGLVSSGQFVPVLEETGLIHEVGRWALARAMEDYQRWQAGGLAAVRIAVNVSPLQLRARDFVAGIQRLVADGRDIAAGLELEITEGVIMEDIDHSVASLSALRSLGITIAIDDFGTGFSSLGYLSRLPIDTLKIDRSFVIGMTDSAEGLALVSTIITLAHSLKLKVVAEGVETTEQSRLLRLLACNEMQGYLFSRPIPCEVFETTFLARQGGSGEGMNYSAVLG